MPPTVACITYLIPLDFTLPPFRWVPGIFIVPTGTLRLPWLRFFSAFSSVVRQMPGYNSQRRGMACTLPQINCVVLCIVVCKCVLYCCLRVSAQLQLTNISTYISVCFCGDIAAEAWIWSLYFITGLIQIIAITPLAIDSHVARRDWYLYDGFWWILTYKLCNFLALPIIFYLFVSKYQEIRVFLNIRRWSRNWPTPATKV